MKHDSLALAVGVTRDKWAPVCVRACALPSNRPFVCV